MEDERTTPEPGRGADRALLEAIAHAQARFVGGGGTREVFDGLLAALLEVTHSEYGFIGEVLRDEAGDPYLKTHAITDISWNAETRRFYAENAPAGMEFRNLKSLFGSVMVTGEPVVANAPATDPRRTGIPHGHPPLNAFLGVPFRSGGAVVGMAGIANRPGGYDDALVAFLQPLMSTLASIVVGVRNEALRREAEERLRHSEARARAILDGAIDGILTLGDGGQVEEVNPAAAALFGLGPAAARGRSIASLLRGETESSAGLLRALEAADANLQAGPGAEFLALRPDGRTVPVFAAPGRALLQGQRSLVTLMVRDITQERHAAAEAARLNEELRLKVEELNRHTVQQTALAALSELLQASRSRTEVFRILGGSSGGALSPAGGTLWVVDDGRFVPAVGWGGGDWPAEFGPDDCWAVRRAAMHRSDPGGYPRCGHLPEGRGAVCMPVVTGSERFGVLTLLAEEPSGGRLDDAERIARAVADRVGLALGQIELWQRLREQSLRDPLTGLYNRRHLDAVLRAELGRAGRAGRHVGLLLIDVDHFKRVNDTWGHDAGDTVLRAVADALVAACRVSDTVCRHGGEEFVVLMPEVAPEDLVRRAEALCSMLCDLRVHHPGGRVDVSVSIGAAGFPASAADQDGLIHAADRALYAAKEAGRGRAVAAPPLEQGTGARVRGSGT